MTKYPVLIIVGVFMFLFPQIAGGQSDSDPDDEPNPLLVRVFGDGRIELGGDRIKNTHVLKAKLSELFATRSAAGADERMVIIIKPARSASIVLKNVIATVKQAGASPIQVVSEENFIEPLDETPPKIPERIFTQRYGIPSGSSDGDGVPKLDATISLPPPTPTTSGIPPATLGLRITSKPKAVYTDKARIENVMGSVHLRVTFLASGKIGNISVIKGLPFGLSAQAVDAAKKMNFEPERKNGVAQNVSKVVEYTFTLY